MELDTEEQVQEQAPDPEATTAALLKVYADPQVIESHKDMSYIREAAEKPNDKIVTEVDGKRGSYFLGQVFRGQQSIDDYAKMAGKSYEEDMLKAFPDQEESVKGARPRFEEEIKKQAQGHILRTFADVHRGHGGMDTGDYWRERIPLLGRVVSRVLNSDEASGVKAIQEGNASGTDYEHAGRFLAKQDTLRGRGMAASVIDHVLGFGQAVAEFAMFGGAGRAAGAAAGGTAKLTLGAAAETALGKAAVYGATAAGEGLGLSAAMAPLEVVPDLIEGKDASKIAFRQLENVIDISLFQGVGGIAKLRPGQQGIARTALNATFGALKLMAAGETAQDLKRQMFTDQEEHPKGPALAYFTAKTPEERAKALNDLAVNGLAAAIFEGAMHAARMGKKANPKALAEEALGTELLRQVTQEGQRPPEGQAAKPPEPTKPTEPPPADDPFGLTRAGKYAEAATPEAKAVEAVPEEVAKVPEPPPEPPKEAPAVEEAAKATKGELVPTERQKDDVQATGDMPSKMQQLLDAPDAFKRLDGGRFVKKQGRHIEFGISGESSVIGSVVADDRVVISTAAHPPDVAKHAAIVAEAVRYFQSVGLRPEFGAFPQSRDWKAVVDNLRSAHGIEAVADAPIFETQPGAKEATPAPPAGASAAEAKLGPTEGWKLHLATDKTEEVSRILKDMGLQHKVGRSGQEGKDITVYVGHGDKANAAAREIEAKAGALLKEPHGETLRDDVSFGGKIMGRFDVGKSDKDFHQYGQKGIPWLNEDMDPFNRKPGAMERADAALKRKYGDFYTGTQSASEAPTPKPPESVAEPAKPQSKAEKWAEKQSGGFTVKDLMKRGTLSRPDAAGKIKEMLQDGRLVEGHDENGESVLYPKIEETGAEPELSEGDLEGLRGKKKPFKALPEDVGQTSDEIRAKLQAQKIAKGEGVPSAETAKGDPAKKDLRERAIAFAGHLSTEAAKRAKEQAEEGAKRAEEYKKLNTPEGWEDWTTQHRDSWLEAQVRQARKELKDGLRTAESELRKSGQPASVRRAVAGSLQKGISDATSDAAAERAKGGESAKDSGQAPAEASGPGTETAAPGGSAADSNQLDRASVVSLAKELVADSRAKQAQRAAVRMYAIQTHKGLGHGDISTLSMRNAKGKLDAPAIKGLDDTAARANEEFPGFFKDESLQSHDDQLFEHLTKRAEPPLTRDKAMRLAEDMLRESQATQKEIQDADALLKKTGRGHTTEQDIATAEAEAAEIRGKELADEADADDAAAAAAHVAQDEPVPAGNDAWDFGPGERPGESGGVASAGQREKIAPGREAWSLPGQGERDFGPGETGDVARLFGFHRIWRGATPLQKANLVRHVDATMADTGMSREEVVDWMKDSSYSADSYFEEYRQPDDLKSLPAERPGARVEPPREEPKDLIAEAAKEIARDDMGAINLSQIGKIAAQVKDRLKRTFARLGDEYAKLSGKMFPATHRADQESGEATARYVVARSYAREASPYYIDKILGPKSPQDARRLAGAVITERRLRHMRDVFTRENDPQAAAAVKTIVGQPNSPLPDDATYQRALASPAMQEILTRWKQYMVPIMENNFKRAEGIDPADPINERTQIKDEPVNLKAQRTGEPATPGTVMAGGGRGNLKNLRLSRLGFAREATGAADGYDIDLGAIIEHSLTKGITAAAKNEMFRTYMDKGLATRDKMGQQIDVNGEKAVEFPFVWRGQQGSFYVDRSVAPELRRALDVDKGETGLSIATGLLTKASLLSTVEAAYHSKNLLTFLFKPGVRGRDFLKDMYNVVTKDMDTQKRLVELARIGALKEKGQETGVYAKYNPLQWMGSLLDVMQRSMRLAGDRAFDRMHQAGLVEGSEASRRDFINQLGQYNRKAQNGLVALLRDTGLGPFATAGSNYYIQGLRSITLNPGVKATSPQAAVQLRAQTLAKTVTVLGAAALANYMMHKRIDGSDSTPLGAVNLGESGGKTHYFDLTNLVGLTRGLRETGLLSLLQGKREGRPTAGIIDKAKEDAVHSLLHPMFGPAPQFLWTATTGKDVFGKYIAAKPQPGGSKTYEEVKVAVEQANPVYKSLMSVGQKKPKPFTERAAELAGPFGVRSRTTMSHAARVRQEEMLRRRH